MISSIIELLKRFPRINLCLNTAIIHNTREVIPMLFKIGIGGEWKDSHWHQRMCDNINLLVFTNYSGTCNHRSINPPFCCTYIILHCVANEKLWSLIYSRLKSHHNTAVQLLKRLWNVLCILHRAVCFPIKVSANSNAL